MHSADTYEHALRAIDGVVELAELGVLVREDYLTPEPVYRDLAEMGAIGGGHGACLLGSLWLGYGEKPLWVDKRSCWDLPGIGDAGDRGGVREEFLRDRPGLRIALQALDGAAGRYLGREFGINPTSKPTDYCSTAEWLFEYVLVANGRGCYDATRVAVIEVARDAQQALREEQLAGTG